ncbi:MAG: type II secretion system protein, partial [Elusimicrobiota bacterium]
MSARRGFTLIEVLVVLTLVGIGLTYASLTFGGYFQRIAAQRAAQVFAQDLTMARNWATRGRRAVVIRFYESGLWYEMEE